MSDFIQLDSDRVINATTLTKFHKAESLEDKDNPLYGYSIWLHTEDDVFVFKFDLEEVRTIVWDALIIFLKEGAGVFSLLAKHGEFKKEIVNE